MKKYIICALIFLLGSTTLWAQSGSMTDNQVMQFIVKEHAKGTSNTQIVTKLMLTSKIARAAATAEILLMLHLGLADSETSNGLLRTSAMTASVTSTLPGYLSSRSCCINKSSVIIIYYIKHFSFCCYNYLYLIR